MKFVKDDLLLIIAVLIFYVGIVIILFVKIEIANKFAIAIGYFGFWYPFLTGINSVKFSRKVLKVKPIKATKIQDLAAQINNVSNQLKNDKKIIVEVTIIDDKNAIIQYK